MQIRHRLTAIIVGSLVLGMMPEESIAAGAARPAGGQTLNRASSMMNNFGRVGAGLSGAYSLPRGSNFGYRSPQSSDGTSRLSGGGGSRLRYRDMSINQSYSPGSGPLLRSGSSNLMQMRMPMTTGNALTGAYKQTLGQQKNTIANLGIGNPLGEASENYLGWVSADAAQASDSLNSSEFSPDASLIYDPAVVSANTDSAGSTDRPKQKNLSELVSNHMLAMKQSYIQQGLEALQSNNYQGALRFFSLAENAALDDPQERAYSKTLMLYAAIAGGQYAQAGNALNFLLEQDPRTNQFKYAGAFNRIFQENNIEMVGDLFEPAGQGIRPPGYQNGAYRAQNQKLEVQATASDSSALRALVAVMEWGRGRRSEAIATAQKLSVPPDHRLALLAPFLKQAASQYKPPMKSETPLTPAEPTPMP